MAAPPLADALRPLLTNPLDEAVGGARWVVGILGDHPSRYSRSPALWNAAFSALGLDARYAAFDVSPDRLDAFVSTMRASPGLLGVNVTVPYKQAVLPFLDGLDPIATAIGATNCVVRTEQGQLLGSNTDAEGALACLTRARPSAPPFFPNLEGATILLIGAGGAGRAVATALLPRLGQPGRLLLVNRTRATAEEVAHAVDPLSGQVSVLPEGQVADVAEGVDIVINASTRGQSGFFSRSDGLVTCLEPYSPLGPSSPAWV
ncbi:MAG: shikimate dehydrogenase family protein, partial [Chloroflexota bacterium]